MKRRSAWLSFTACALTAAAASSPLRAEAKSTAAPDSSFSQLEIVSYTSGLTGFFDKKSGKMYLYDSSLKNCVGTINLRQLTLLGEANPTLKYFPGESPDGQA